MPPRAVDVERERMPAVGDEDIARAQNEDGSRRLTPHVNCKEVSQELRRSRNNSVDSLSASAFVR